jgi:hypothetical protein
MIRPTSNISDIFEYHRNHLLAYELNLNISCAVLLSKINIGYYITLVSYYYYFRLKKASLLDLQDLTRHEPDFVSPCENNSHHS